MASRATVSTPGIPQAPAWNRSAFFSMASLPHLGTAARNQVMVRTTHHTLPAMVKKYSTMKRRTSPVLPGPPRPPTLSLSLSLSLTLLCEPCVTVAALKRPALGALQATVSSSRKPRKNTSDTIM
ncbi:hypothetical protein EYF80_056461 [Liparis tanakae]|uniref:Uncharacterized protein n=1 Tax=Liparis tanakae TaxID=230148 RepID=A0A4Z2EWY0_9TELE|nr:hypothetical protein EYF80_056461 [Liparis tanakae]